MNLVTLAAVALLRVGASAAPTIVFCSPGAPGTTAEAQPTMDAFAAAVAARAALPRMAAVYEDAEDAGVARLREKDAALAVVSLPFFLKHERELALRARLQPVPKGREATERWTLVARKGAVRSAAALDGYTVVSSAGFAPAFVRGPAVGTWGPLPASVRVQTSTAVLSALRRAAAGEKIAVLLDGAQGAAVSSLPFAAELDVLTRSVPLPAGIVAAIDAHVPPQSLAALETALAALPREPSGVAALDAIQTARFVPLDEKALAAARKAYDEGSR